MTKRMLIMLGVVALFVGGIGAVKVTQIQGAIDRAVKSAPPPPAVTTAVARRERWQPALSAVGSLKAVNGVTVSTDLAGIVSRIAFRSGQPVKKGDLLIGLDAQQEEAQLRSAEARRDLAKLNLERQRDLVSGGAVSRSEYDDADTELRRAVAAVDETRALIARKTIAAPFAGVLGIRQVDLGQYLNPGAPIVALQSMDPIHVEFSVPQQNLEQVALGRVLRIKAEGVAGDPLEGEITAVDSRLDEGTRNLLIQGTVRNAEGKLRPGMFVNVEVLLAPREVISIPTSSISYAPYGDSVFVVEEGRVRQQFVKLGPNRGDQVSIFSGVEEGAEVVSSGAFKLRAGMPVQVQNGVQPGNDADPRPPNS